MTFQLPAVENKSACKFRKKSTLLLCSTVSGCSICYNFDVTIAAYYITRMYQLEGHFITSYTSVTILRLCHKTETSMSSAVMFRACYLQVRIESTLRKKWHVLVR